MTQRICTACGTQYSLSFGSKLAAHSSQLVCPICADERQYIPEQGQTWTTHGALLQTHSVHIHQLQEKVYELEILPRFAIGQRALLVLLEEGNILWDCIPLLDEAAIRFIRSKGGLRAIAISHPHYYSNMNHWGDTFRCPVYLHHSDEQWIMDKGPRITLWSDANKELWQDMRLINIGGHFPGSSILHVPALSSQGTIFSGDTLYVAPSKKFTAAMYSYPNRIPLPVVEVAHMRDRFAAIPFDTLYGFYSYQNLIGHAKEIVLHSLDRYS